MPLRLARIELGGIEQVKEEVRGARGLAALDSLIRDLRHALRDLIRAPGFSLSVVVTLGLALGANAAVVSLLDKLILRPLPVSEPRRLVTVVAPPLPERGRGLCAIGIFGLTNFTVARREQEIGIRIALGATRRSIQWIVMREVSLPATLGCALGLMIFLFAGRVLSAVLFELGPSDPASLAIGPAILCGAAFLAGFLPAYRAARLDPIQTLARSRIRFVRGARTRGDARGIVENPATIFGTEPQRKQAEASNRAV